MEKDVKKNADVGSAPYAGSGKLTDYKKDGSWMMNQIEKGYDKCDRGIKVDNTDPEHKRFASLATDLAAESIVIGKFYGVDPTNGDFYLEWDLCCDGATECSLGEINSVVEFLESKSDADWQRLSLACPGIDFAGLTDAMVSFATGCIYKRAVLKAGEGGSDCLVKALDEAGFAKVEENAEG